jgi:hypothetical protein
MQEKGMHRSNEDCDRRRHAFSSPVRSNDDASQALLSFAWLCWWVTGSRDLGNRHTHQPHTNNDASEAQSAAQLECIPTFGPLVLYTSLVVNHRCGCVRTDTKPSRCSSTGLLKNPASKRPEVQRQELKRKHTAYSTLNMQRQKL